LKGKGHDGMTMAGPSGLPEDERASLVGPMAAARWLLVFVLIAGVYFFHGFVVPGLGALVIGLSSS
jgi:hypothetical protein